MYAFLNKLYAQKSEFWRIKTRTVNPRIVVHSFKIVNEFDIIYV